MKILTNSSFNLIVDSIIQNYCRSHLPNKAPFPPKKLAPVEAPVAVSPKQVQIDVPKKPAPIKAPVKKTTVEPPKKLQTVVPKAPVAVPKLKENSDIESSSNSENESSSSSDSEVDMIVSKVSESLKPTPSEESDSDHEDSDNCMLDADEIQDEEGNTYYIDEAKSVIKLDDEGYGERLGMLKEFKSGNLFYKNKRWKIEYFPKK
jgi:hypothetical protein